jgi:hypothetical protein
MPDPSAPDLGQPRVLLGSWDATTAERERAAAAFSAAATRTRTAPRGGVRDPRQLLAAEQVLMSPQSQLQYRIERLLGAGGFGQVYLAQRIGRSSLVPATVCIKASVRIDGWVREAYFGQLLDGHPRAIRVYDSFPLLRPDGRVALLPGARVRAHGDLRAFLRRTGSGWPSARRAARSRASCRCSASCTAASCCTAT